MMNDSIKCLPNLTSLLFGNDECDSKLNSIDLSFRQAKECMSFICVNYFLY